MLSFVFIIYAALALFVVRTTAYSQKEHDCRDKSICLTSFVFCGVTHGKQGCDYGENEFPIHSDLDRNTGYGVIDMYEEYNITWKNADPNYAVNFTWSFGTYYTQIEWSISMCFLAGKWFLS